MLTKIKKAKLVKPYITHVMRVMERCKTEEEKIVAVLHDVVEDTSISIDDLRKERFSEKILAAVTAITQNKGESKTNYIKRVKKNPLAIRVKLNDLEDNMDVRRLPKITDWDVKQLKGYLRIYRQLLKDIST
jgi:(p)ppGpp synthase/HD superfamily hydrolase